MKILKTGCGNSYEAYIEDRLTDGVNIIFSNDNNKGKTIIFQGLMYALGNDPIFPSGFEYKNYYFYTSIEHRGKIYEFLRRNNSIAIKSDSEITMLDDISDLKYYFSKNIFELPYIIKDDFQKMVDLSLFYQLFFVGQDKRNPSNLINAGYYNKQDFINLIYSMTGCLTLSDSIKRLKDLLNDLHICKSEIAVLSKRLTFYREHPEIASTVSKGADRERLEKERMELQSINQTISDRQRKRTRLINRKIKLETLLSELNSLNRQLKIGGIRCQDCGSENVTYSNGELSFELTNDLVRKNIIKSIYESIELYNSQISELQQMINSKQTELNERMKKVPVPMANILIYTDTIKSYEEDEKRLSDLHDKKAFLEAEIENEQKVRDANTAMQAETKAAILDSMNSFYKLIDPDGTQEFKDFFATRNMTFSGSEEQEYYFSRTLAIFWHLHHDFPIIMDCFRKGELSTQKENTMIEEYKKTKQQVILSSTLKDEEYHSGSKYYSIPNVTAINYEPNTNSHILQKCNCENFMDIVSSFGIIFKT